VRWRGVTALVDELVDDLVVTMAFLSESDKPTKQGTKRRRRRSIEDERWRYW